MKKIILITALFLIVMSVVVVAGIKLKFDVRRCDDWREAKCVYMNNDIIVVVPTTEDAGDLAVCMPEKWFSKGKLETLFEEGWYESVSKTEHICKWF